ncbi:MAG: polyprenyl synthetase family protein [Phycisphaerales bacterium]|nr:polyprenyl synthetase family protein [Phycisphaerales bacterium]
MPFYTLNKDMPTITANFRHLIAPQLCSVNELFARELASDLSNVNSLITHVSEFRGKMLRPTLVLLSGLAAAKDAGGGAPLTSQHITIATVIEMVHVATLVHDDVLDDAKIRRNGSTINYLHGNEAAVLLGGYLVSHAYHLCSTLDSQDASRLIAHTTNLVCEGELIQNFNRNNWTLDEKTYYFIIDRKTAALTAICCRLGAMTSTRNPTHIESLATYGQKIGLAFQIVDDLLDICGNQQTVGKSLGTDIEKGKLTLPMIHFLQHAPSRNRNLLIDLLESDAPDRTTRVRQLIAPSDSIAYAQSEAERLVNESIAALQPLPPSEAREALIQTAHYVTERDK